MAKERVLELDVFKGISILLIILLHSMCRFPINLHDAEPLQWVNSLIAFTSPLALFFFASGFLFSKSADESNVEFIKKKAVRLLIPLFFFSILKVTLKYAASSIVRSPSESLVRDFLGIFLGEQYWFLYSLFLIFIINKLFYNQRALIAIVILVLNLFGLLNTSLFTIDNMSYYNSFFVIGSYVGEWGGVSSVREFIMKHKFFVTVATLLTLSMGTILCFIYFKPGITSIQFLLGLIAIPTMWTLSVCLMNSNALSYFGKFSLQYYLNHLVIILACFYIGSYCYRLLGSYHVSLLVVFCSAVLIAQLMLIIEKKCKKVRILFGL